MRTTFHIPRGVSIADVYCTYAVGADTVVHSNDSVNMAGRGDLITVFSGDRELALKVADVTCDRLSQVFNVFRL